MEKKLFMSYEAPLVEIIEVEVEQGFATSNDGATRDFDFGGDLS